MATAKKAAAPKAAAKKAPSRKAGAKKSGAAAKKSGAAAKKSGAAAKKSGAGTKKSGSAAKKSGAGRKTPAKKSTPRKRAAKPRFGEVFLEKQRQALLAERRRYTEHAERYEAEAEQLVSEREPGDVQFDEESGEGDSIAVERDRALQISAREREEIAEIDAALARIDEGTYGICVVSGKPIPKERLEAIPHASMRVEVKSSGPAWRRP